MSDQTPLQHSPSHFADLHDGIRDLLGKEWFFIGAFPKSGTTWLQVTLDAHPEILCRGESHFANVLSPALSWLLSNQNKLIDSKNTSIFKEFFPFPQFGDADFEYLLKSALGLLMLRSGDTANARLIGEKTPDNVRFFPQLQRLFPQARFMNILRDGRDCAVSMWFHNQRTINAQTQKYESLDAFAISIAPSWRAHVIEGMRFADAAPRHCLNVSYEDLISHTPTVLGTILHFLGASQSDGDVAACMEVGSFQRMSGGRSPGQEDQSSFMRRAEPGNWREHLSPAANKTFIATAGDVLALLGYDC